MTREDEWTGGPAELAPLEVLWDRTGASSPLPPALNALYGGGLDFERPVLYANFVQSIDGVVALRSVPTPAPMISGHSAADRFVMALLRACADGVLVGAGTMRDTPVPWTHDAVFPELGDQFARLRSDLGLSQEPDLLLLTSSGRIDIEHPALHRGARVLTTATGAQRIGDSLPAASSVHTLSGDGKIDIGEAIGFVRDHGYRRVLSEAGPTVTGQLIEAGLLDELFVTVSPVLAGSGEGDGVTLADGARMLPARRECRRLLSVRRHGSYLFLRYGQVEPDREG